MSELDGWKYCPRCRAELSRDAGKLECSDCGFVTYGSSKPTASGLVLDDAGRVLLSRRGVDPDEGKWDFPGGFLEEGEHPIECLRRELEEEAGIEVEPRRFLGAWTDVYGDREIATLNLYWTASVVEGTPEPADDVAEFRWFALDEIPRDQLAFSHLPEVISAWRDEDA